MPLRKLKGKSFAAKNVHFLSLVILDSENLALKDYSSIDILRYNSIIFVSLIKLNGESISAKNVHFLSLVNLNSENLALKDYSSIDSPRYDCGLFVSLINKNAKSFAAKNVHFLSLVNLNSENLAFYRLLIYILTKVCLPTFCVTSQVKRQIHYCKNYTLLIKLNGESFDAKKVHFLSLVNLYSEILALKNHSTFDSPRYDHIFF